jgi:hypothetical protein
MRVRLHSSHALSRLLLVVVALGLMAMGLALDARAFLVVPPAGHGRGGAPIREVR